MKNRSTLTAVLVALSTVCFLSSSVFAAQNGTLDTNVTPNTYTITVGASDADVTLNNDDVTVLGTNVKLIKNGLGRLIVATNMSTWEGDFDIEAGYVRLSENYADGKQDTGTLTLTPGATIELGGDGVSANRALLRRKYMYIGGYGMNNAGAVFAIGNSQNQIFRGGVNEGASTTYLTSDTYFKCSPTIGPRAGTFRLQGYKLIADGGTFETCAALMHGPGELIMTNSCCLYFENSSQAMLFAGSSSVGPITENIIRLYQGCSIKQGGNGVGGWYPARVPFKVIAEENATLTTGWYPNLGS